MKRGKKEISPSMGGRKTVIASTVAGAPACTPDTSSMIEEFTDVMVESPGPKRGSNEKLPAVLEDTSIVTTPGGTYHAGTIARSEASVIRPKPSVTATAKQSASRKKAAKAKPELVTPTEFARRLQEQGSTKSSATLPPPQTSDNGDRKVTHSSSKLPIKTVQLSQYLKDHVIFYTGGDLTYASARTRGCMNYVCILLVISSHAQTLRIDP